jgi:hypothetical protein
MWHVYGEDQCKQDLCGNLEETDYSSLKEDNIKINLEYIWWECIA